MEHPSVELDPVKARILIEDWCCDDQGEALVLKLLPQLDVLPGRDPGSSLRDWMRIWGEARNLSPRTECDVGIRPEVPLLGVECDI